MKLLATKICEYCKKEFTPVVYNQKYCYNCKNNKNIKKELKKMMWVRWFRRTTGCGPKEKNCIVCGNIFIAKSKQEKWCYNNECRLIYQRQKALKRYYEKREERLKKIKEVFKKCPEKYLVHKMRANIRDALNRQNAKKFMKSRILIGCSPVELKDYLEKLFKPGMTWKNYKLHGWEVDHIIPCDNFDLTNIEEQKKCFHYTNLQPLWMRENRQKSCKVQ
jgi:hypothetical protein